MYLREKKRRCHCNMKKSNYVKKCYKSGIEKSRIGEEWYQCRKYS